MAGSGSGRGEVRRQVILAAAMAIVAREGAGALTHRAVAAEAGVSLASTTYHFAGIDDLRRTTFEWAADEIGSGFEGALAKAQSSTEPLNAVTEQWARVLAEHRAAFTAVLEMLIAAGRDPELRRVAEDLLTRPAQLLAFAGFEDPPALVAELIGLALVHLIEVHSDVGDFSRRALELIRRHAAEGD
ncbi:TetR family transcriptional regulator [Microbacterium sp. LWS13-1.2]|uniref:TetR family transcriptional regulator n=1 Tax=Microbacterium sp. LWS13-1.2 TaxID=3135264 RepID=A0AAU6SBK9_9MICO